MFNLSDFYIQCDTFYELELIQHIGFNITIVHFNTGDYSITFIFNQWLTPKQKSIRKLIELKVSEPIKCNIYKNW